jgi:hypothetical protein
MPNHRRGSVISRINDAGGKQFMTYVHNKFISPNLTRSLRISLKNKFTKQKDHPLGGLFAW